MKVVQMEVSRVLPGFKKGQAATAASSSASLPPVDARVTFSPEPNGTERAHLLPDECSSQTADLSPTQERVPVPHHKGHHCTWIS